MTTKFIAGDKVRTTTFGRRQLGNSASLKVGGVQTVATGTDGYGYIQLAGIRGIWSSSYFEKVPFQIAAGKTYKTRNGLKVGPMQAVTGFDWYDAAYKFKAKDPEGDVTAWTAEGCYFSHGGTNDYDLVAEWVEPAVPASPAFKSGDRVQCKNGDNWSTGERVVTVSHVIGDRVFSKETGMSRPAETLELAPATPAAPAYVPKVGDQVGGIGIHSGRPRFGKIESINTYDIDLVDGTTIRKNGVKLLSTPGSFIVVGVKNGKMQAAANPFIHPTREAAEKEALRLAELVRGDDFRVYSFGHLSTANAAPVVAPAAKLSNAASL